MDAPDRQCLSVTWHLWARSLISSHRGQVLTWRVSRGIKMHDKDAENSGKHRWRQVSKSMGGLTHYPYEFEIILGTRVLGGPNASDISRFTRTHIYRLRMPHLKKSHNVKGDYSKFHFLILKTGGTSMNYWYRCGSPHIYNAIYSILAALIFWTSSNLYLPQPSSILSSLLLSFLLFLPVFYSTSFPPSPNL